MNLFSYYLQCHLCAHCAFSKSITNVTLCVRTKKKLRGLQSASELYRLSDRHRSANFSAILEKVNYYEIVMRLHIVSNEIERQRILWISLIQEV
jgi:hypothetical protein